MQETLPTTLFFSLYPKNAEGKSHRVMRRKISANTKKRKGWQHMEVVWTPKSYDQDSKGEDLRNRKKTFITLNTDPRLRNTKGHVLGEVQLGVVYVTNKKEKNASR